LVEDKKRRLIPYYWFLAQLGLFLAQLGCASLWFYEVKPKRSKSSILKAWFPKGKQSRAKPLHAALAFFCFLFLIVLLKKKRKNAYFLFAGVIS